ncbi:trypsin Inhibitor like cysteine rich domain protein [Ancylostoma duodenale]|uniref:Trypsin Inhibitor like cysteine rich domain protein n=1 Tax=Ancylostoma duodenale TaxID=51022 RepID=A0A0C2GXP1_9BILA|nr:trypsin Inhibitor like cysteine rich domain protein [Ancylostoma duodenale]
MTWKEAERANAHQLPLSKGLQELIQKSKCGKNEVFRLCFSACEPTCDEPYLRYRFMCRLSGRCACKSSYLHDEDWKCVPHTCTEENEEYDDYLVY